MPICTALRRARDVFRQLAFPSNSLGLVTGIDVMAAAGLAFTSLSMEAQTSFALIAMSVSGMRTCWYWASAAIRHM